MSDLVLARNCCLARMPAREAELVSECTGLSGRAKRVKRFERSSGLVDWILCYLFNFSLVATSRNVKATALLVKVLL